MNEYPDIARGLQQNLALPLPPVAVTFADAVPAGIPSFAGQVPAGCSFWEHAATRTFATAPRDHALCSIGVHTHNLQPTDRQETELNAVLTVLRQMEYVREADVPQIPVLGRKAQHVIYGPLEQATTTPDVVLLFARVGDSLIVTEAVQQVEMGIPPAMGRPACAAIPQAVNTGRAAMSLGCCGARAYLDGMSSDIVLWALPGARIKVYADRIAALAGVNKTLSEFHRIRRRDVEAGGRPTYGESLARLQS